MQRRIASTLERKFVDQSFEHGEQGYTFKMHKADLRVLDANKVFVPDFFFTVPKNAHRIIKDKGL